MSPYGHGGRGDEGEVKRTRLVEVEGHGRVPV